MTPKLDITLTALEGDATRALQEALDQARKAPLTLTLARGRYRTGGLRLYSDTELHLAEGAELDFVSDYDAYATNRVSVEAEDSDRAMLFAADAEHVAVTGPGRINGNGLAFAIGEDGAGTRMPAFHRPRLAVFERCKGLRLEGFSIADSPMWTLHIIACEEVRIAGLSIANDLRMPNTDCMAIDSSRNVIIEECRMAAADDGVVLKTKIGTDGKPVGPCEQITVRRCEIQSKGCAMKLGTESFSDFRDITFEDCSVVGSSRAMGLFSRDGGVMERVRFARISVDSNETPDGFWGSGEALAISVIDRRPERPAGAVRDVVAEDITGRMEGALHLHAERPGLISGVTLRHVALSQQPGPLGTALRYDLRPTHDDLEPPEGVEGRANAWLKGADGQVLGTHPYPGGMPGLSARGVAELSLEEVEITRPDPLPEGWNPEVVVIEDA